MDIVTVTGKPRDTPTDPKMAVPAFLQRYISTVMHFDKPYQTTLFTLTTLQALCHRNRKHRYRLCATGTASTEAYFHLTLYGHLSYNEMQSFFDLVNVIRYWFLVYLTTLCHLQKLFNLELIGFL